MVPFFLGGGKVVGLMVLPSVGGLMYVFFPLLSFFLFFSPLSFFFLLLLSSVSSLLFLLLSLKSL